MPTKLGALVAAEVFTHTIGNAGLAAWTTWSPSYTNLTIGNGTVTAKYAYAGRTTFIKWRLLFGSTTSVSGWPLVSLPVTAADVLALGTAVLWDSSASSNYGAGVFHNSTTTVGPVYINTAAAAASMIAVSSTQPFTWATSDEITLNLTYEATS